MEYIVHFTMKLNPNPFINLAALGCGYITGPAEQSCFFTFMEHVLTMNSVLPEPRTLK